MRVFHPFQPVRVAVSASHSMHELVLTMENVRRGVGTWSTSTSVNPECVARLQVCSFSITLEILNYIQDVYLYWQRIKNCITNVCHLPAICTVLCLLLVQVLVVVCNLQVHVQHVACGDCRHAINVMSYSLPVQVAPHLCFAKGLYYLYHRLGSIISIHY